MFKAAARRLLLPLTPPAVSLELLLGVITPAVLVLLGAAANLDLIVELVPGTGLLTDVRDAELVVASFLGCFFSHSCIFLSISARA